MRTTFANRSLIIWINMVLCLSLNAQIPNKGDTNNVPGGLNADGEWHTIEYSGKAVDLRVPFTHYNQIQFKVVGADGGSAKTDGCDRVAGGAGAIVSGTIAIGDEGYEVPKGASLRFIVGQGGENTNDTGGAGGGGGSALLLATPSPNTPFKILAVAGGGGGAAIMVNGWGACYEDPGNNASIDQNGGTADGGGDEKGTPGSGGGGAIEGSDFYDASGGGGGGATSDAHVERNTDGSGRSGKKGQWDGGYGGWQKVNLSDYNNNDLFLEGGWGFGGGGGGLIQWSNDRGWGYSSGGGGGGGYSGGANGAYWQSYWGDDRRASGGGGGSYVLDGIKSHNIVVGNRTTDTHNGSIAYRFSCDYNVTITGVEQLVPYCGPEGAVVQVNYKTAVCADPANLRFKLYKADQSTPPIGKPPLQANISGQFTHVTPGKYWVLITQMSLDLIELPAAQKVFTLSGTDVTLPVAVCKDITLDLEGNCSYLVAGLGDVLDGGSTDDCSITEKTASRSSFSCSDVGKVLNVQLTVKDAAGNSNACTSKVTVVNSGGN